MTSPHGMGAGEQVGSSVMLLATLAKSMGICDGAPLTAHSSCVLFELQFLTGNKSHIKKVIKNILIPAHIYYLRLTTT